MFPELWIIWAEESFATCIKNVCVIQIYCPLDNEVFGEIKSALVYCNNTHTQDCTLTEIIIPGNLSCLDNVLEAWKYMGGGI